jgi:type IV pilus assembly protein PilB
MVAVTLQGSLTGLARAMVQRGILSEREAEAVQSQANSARLPFIEQLIQAKRISETEVAEFASETFGIPLIDLHAFDLEQLPLAAVGERFIQTHRALPLFRRGNKLFVGMSDPTVRRPLDEVEAVTNE